jgi:hypothetical protein
MHNFQVLACYGELASHCNSISISSKWQVIKTASHQSSKQSKQRVIKAASNQSSESSKQRVIKAASHQTSE